MVTHHSIVEVTTTIDNHICVKSAMPVQLSGFRALNVFDPKIDWKLLIDKLASYIWTADFRNKTTEQMLTEMLGVTLAFAKEDAPLRKMHKNILSRRARKRLNVSRRIKRIKQMMKKTQSLRKYKKLRKQHIKIELELMKNFRQNNCDK